MTVNVPWQTLRVNHDGLPTLLVKAELQPNGYSILLTDLGNIWSERLTQLDIVNRAQSCGSSIDPSQGEDQQEILLTHIGKALNNEDGTTLKLCQGSDSPESLSLYLTAPLPSQLPPLQWVMYLQISRARMIEAEIVTPLLHEAGRLRKQVQYLITELHNKDRVISKISDRLEVSGNDLTTVFPNVSRVKTSRKKSQREQLGPHIQGLSDFNEHSWRAQMKDSKIDGNLPLDAVDEVLAGIHSRDIRVSDDLAEDKWWQHLTSGPSHGRAIPQHQESGHRTPDKQHASQDDAQVDDFQRQSTPPQPRKRLDGGERESPRGQSMAANSLQSTSLHDDSTEDEDDLDVPASNRNTVQQLSQMAVDPATSPTSNPATTSVSSQANRVHGDCTNFEDPAAAGIGTGPQKMAISMSKQGVESRNNKAVTKPLKPNTQLGVVGGKRHEPKTESIAPVMLPRSKLGVFGGKADTPTAMKVISQAEPPVSSPETKHARLGVVGGAKKADGNEPQSRTKVRGSSHASTPPPTKEPTPEPQETEAERADRKRTQLKMELEEKAKAHVKKKRKF